MGGVNLHVRTSSKSSSSSNRLINTYILKYNVFLSGNWHESTGVLGSRYQLSRERKRKIKIIISCRSQPPPYSKSRRTRLPRSPPPPPAVATPLTGHARRAPPTSRVISKPTRIQDKYWEKSQKSPKRTRPFIKVNTE